MKSFGQIWRIPRRKLPSAPERSSTPSEKLTAALPRHWAKIVEHPSDLARRRPARRTPASLRTSPHGRDRLIACAGRIVGGYQCKILTATVVRSSRTASASQLAPAYADWRRALARLVRTDQPAASASLTTASVRMPSVGLINTATRAAPASARARVRASFRQLFDKKMMPVLAIRAGEAGDKAEFGPAVEDPDYRHRLLLRACRERPTAAALPTLL